MSEITLRDKSFDEIIAYLNEHKPDNTQFSKLLRDTLAYQPSETLLAALFSYHEANKLALLNIQQICSQSFIKTIMTSLANTLKSNFLRNKINLIEIILLNIQHMEIIQWNMSSYLVSKKLKIVIQNCFAVSKLLCFID